MQIDLQAATDETLPVVHNLAQFYSYDLSAISDHEYFSCRENGLFVNACEKYQLAHCDIHLIHLIRVDAELAGFTIAGPDHLTEDRVFTDADHLYTIWEFFILRRFRRQGVGTQVAHQTFDRYRGPWYVPVWSPNEAAVNFWDRTISQYTSGQSTSALEFRDGHEMFVHRFHNDS